MNTHASNVARETHARVHLPHGSESAWRTRESAEASGRCQRHRAPVNDDYARTWIRYTDVLPFEVFGHACWFEAMSAGSESDCGCLSIAAFTHTDPHKFGCTIFTRDTLCMDLYFGDSSPIYVLPHHVAQSCPDVAWACALCLLKFCLW